MVVPSQSAESCAGSDTNLICAQIVRVCTERFGASLRAIVLTGSLARAEGTWVHDCQKRTLLGDVDVFLVFHTGAKLPKDIHSVQNEIGRALAEHDVIADIGLAPVNPCFLARMPRTIATYELRTCGRVLWGDAAVLSQVPKFFGADISREDAWRMLANRMIEQLEAAAEDGLLSPRSQYATVKLFLDMATSYLVFIGCYRPRYIDRARMLGDASRSHAAHSPFPLALFSDIVSAVTAFKLEATPVPYAPEQLWSEALRHATALWYWQLIRLAGGSSGSPSDDPLKHWTRQMAWNARLRGWASAARRSPHDVKLWLSWLPLIPKGSPRHLIYGTASELFFRMKDSDLRSCRVLSANLPLPYKPGREVNTWESLAKQIAVNYHQLLEDTTA